MKIMELISDQQGIVVKRSTGSYNVLLGDRTLSCVLANQLRKDLIYPIAAPWSRRPVVQEVRRKEHADLVAVGDLVQVAEEADHHGIIINVLPRMNRLARRTSVPMPGAHPFEQVIAANIDQVFPVFAATKPTPKWNMLDRYLASAESLGLPSVICINKLDLVRDGDGKLEPELEAVIKEYRRIGYPVVLTSTITGEGIEELRDHLRSSISVFVGKSGVGKTSLLNALQPDLGLRIKEVNQTTGKGKHTTTFVELVRLDFGGFVADTPGVREFGLWNVEEGDLAACFPEMRPYLGSCRFSSDCQHLDEPGCAIRKAVMAGQINPRRYKNYLQLMQEGYFHE
jgi:ribosome biogenesis GTPase / thiamine phosphate phosphatase